MGNISLWCLLFPENWKSNTVVISRFPVGISKSGKHFGISDLFILISTK